MNEDLNNLISEFEQLSARVWETFGHLSHEQLNWRPSAESWSIGQCFDHLIKTNKSFFSELDAVAAGTRKNSFFESYSPLTGFWGRFVINALKKDGRKLKAPSGAIIPTGSIDAGIIEQFTRHQQEVIEKVKGTAEADWRKTVITSPFMKFITYSLGDGIRSMIEHEKRHFRQAERVMQAAGFPKPAPETAVVV